MNINGFLTVWGFCWFCLFVCTNPISLLSQGACKVTGEFEEPGLRPAFVSGSAELGAF